MLLSVLSKLVFGGKLKTSYLQILLCFGFTRVESSPVREA